MNVYLCKDVKKTVWRDETKNEVFGENKEASLTISIKVMIPK